MYFDNFNLSFFRHILKTATQIWIEFDSCVDITIFNMHVEALVVKFINWRILSGTHSEIIK